MHSHRKGQPLRQSPLRRLRKLRADRFDRFQGIIPFLPVIYIGKKQIAPCHFPCVIRADYLLCAILIFQMHLYQQFPLVAVKSFLFCLIEPEPPFVPPIPQKNGQHTFALHLRGHIIRLIL